MNGLFYSDETRAFREEFAIYEDYLAVLVLDPYAVAFLCNKTQGEYRQGVWPKSGPVVRREFVALFQTINSNFGEYTSPQKLDSLLR